MKSFIKWFGNIRISIIEQTGVDDKRFWGAKGRYNLIGCEYTERAVYSNSYEGALKECLRQVRGAL